LTRNFQKIGEKDYSKIFKKILGRIETKKGRKAKQNTVFI